MDPAHEGSPPNPPARTRFDLLLRLEIWALAASLVLSVASMFVAPDSVWMLAALTASAVSAVVIVLTPAFALPFIARRSDPPLAPRLAWLAGSSGMAILLVGVIVAVEESLPGVIGGAVIALLGARAIVHAWRRSAREGGRTVSRDAISAFSLSAFVLVLAWGAANVEPHSKERAYRTAMRSDLRLLVSYQQDRFDSTGRFGDSVQLRKEGFETSPRVNLRLVADSVSWSAVASYDSSALQCFTWGGVRPTDARFAAPELESLCSTPDMPPAKPWISVSYPAQHDDHMLDSAAATAALLLSVYGDTSSTFSGTAVAEGLVNGKRSTLPLKVTPTSRGGVFAVHRQWPDQGAWVLLFATTRDAEVGDFVVVETRSSGIISEQRFEKRKAARKSLEKRLSANSLPAGR